MTGAACAMKACRAPETLGLAPSFGFGDRMGLATPGHLDAMAEAGGAIRGIFGQQSIREMHRTHRAPAEVMRAATDALAAAEFADPWGADADHLKTPEDIRRTMAAGFTFFTLDPSGEVDQEADGYDAATLKQRFAAVRQVVPWVAQYLGRRVPLDRAEIVFDEQAVLRAAVKYGRAMERAISLARAVAEEAARLGRKFELELSVDETAQPTTYAEHYLIAEQLRQADVQIVSIAPRFIGDFEKGVDYRGDLAELEMTLSVHAEIAERLGPYKLSLHSGSDKLSMYGALARTTRGRFHVKTAGTSYLEALRVAAHHHPRLFREIIAFSREHYDLDKATYHVSATLSSAPPVEEVTDPVKLEQLYLERWEDVKPGCGFTALGRQILHCTFGSVVTDGRLGPRLRDLLKDRPDEYREILRQHFVRHLEALRP